MTFSLPGLLIFVLVLACYKTVNLTNVQKTIIIETYNNYFLIMKAPLMSLYNYNPFFTVV